MRFRTVFRSSLSLLILLLAFSCSSDDALPEEEEVEIELPPDSENEEPDNEDPEPEIAGTVSFIAPLKVEDDYILVNDVQSHRAFLMDKKAQIVHEWPLSTKLGNDAFLLPNGRLLVSAQVDEPFLTFGGQAGEIQILDKDGTIEWSYLYTSQEAETHHDVELLPNGNILAMVWEKRTLEEAVAAGSSQDIALYPEALIEINPGNNEIVWEWHAWDHLIQDFDETANNYGVIAENPNRIDINYFPEENGDIMHANGIGYDAVNDLIFLSVNFFSEVWVIDHSTTTIQAAGQEGGNYSQGGDLIYRFGNPEAYDNPMGERRFINNHFPNLGTGIDAGKIHIFTNGGETEISTAYEFQLPAILALTPNTDNEPAVTWSFSHPDLYSPKVSGVVKLPNGNRLITEGDYGYWEVTETGEVVWKFNTEGFFWRGYHYAKDAPEIILLGL